MAAPQPTGVMETSEKATEDSSVPVGETVTKQTPGETHDEATSPINDSSTDKKKTAMKEALHITISMFGLMTGVLLVALDTNILAIVIPKITTEFSSLDDVAWYGSAYSLTKMALQPTFGRLYYGLGLKLVFCFSIALFLAGSIAVAARGIMPGVLSIMAFIVSKEKMPIFIAISSGTYAVSGILGPTIGGILGESWLTWRFCFWINLPIGFVATLIVVFGFSEPERESTKVPLREKLASLDPISSCILLGAITSLILALQWGGVTYPWSDSKVWGCLLGFALLLTVFVLLQIRRKDKALIPMRILTQRTVAATCAIVTFQMMTVTGITYYLPVFFQSSKGVSSTTAGLYLLGFSLPSPVFSFISGWAVTLTGHYIPWLLAGGVVLTIAAGLLSTLTLANSALGRIIGFEFLASAGFGVAVQQPLVAIRNVLQAEDMPMGNALFVFFQGFGTALGLAVSEVIFLSTLKTRLETGLSEQGVEDVIAVGAAGQDQIPPDLVPFVAASYGVSVQTALYLTIATAGVSFLCSFLVEWKRVIPEQKGEQNEESKEQPKSN
ncbi:putative MFS toxin efflux pump [Xylariomycetidae sp. FL2044]|nr:putative MFS toxin efflux pump [Xylariomycetidae sp. FL2044]